MQQNNSKPKAPDTKRLEEVIDQIDSDISMADVMGSIEITRHDAQFVRDTLIWTINMLSGRKLYQKKQQVKKKIINRLIRQHLDKAELANIDATAAKEAAATILSAVEVDGSDDTDTGH